MKVLLASITNVVKEYCLWDWIEHVKKLTYPDIDIFLCDNSPNSDFAEKIKAKGINCVWENPNEREARYFMAASNEKTRVKFLAGDYSHYFSLECDVFPPLDIIEKLLVHDVDVGGTTYWTDHKYNSHLQLSEIYCFHEDPVSMTREYKERQLSFEEGQLFMDGSLKPVYGNGMGCKLIKRWVMDEIPFRINPANEGFADSFFNEDLWKNGIPNYVDTQIIPLHRNSNWNTILADSLHKKLQMAKKQK
jgi:hypothetical protein